MRKGKFGICLCFYGILAFILAILGQSLLGALLLVFVLVAEKDEWAAKQTMQAFFLALFSAAVSFVLNLLNTFAFTYFAAASYSIFEGWVVKIVDIAVLVFAIIGIVKNAKDQDAGIPVFSSLADKIYGHFAPKAGTGYNPYVNPQNAQPQQNQYAPTSHNNESSEQEQNSPYTFNNK